MSESAAPEIRLKPDGSLDEVVADGASFHLERMSGTSWWLSVSVGGKRVAVWLRSSRKIGAYYEQSEVEDGIGCEPMGRKSPS